MSKVNWEDIKHKPFKVCSSCKKLFPCAEVRKDSKWVFMCRKCYNNEQ